MQDENNQLQAWDEATQDQETESVTLEQMDQMVAHLRELKDQAEDAQKHADEIGKAYQAQREVVMKTLIANNRDKYEVDGVGLVYVSRKEVYRVPKSNEDKTKLFNYIKEKYGPDALMAMVGIHSATLGAWANKESETGVMQIPGLEAPTMVETLNMRKK